MTLHSISPLVSVIIPAYNRFEEVQVAIESVLKQSYKIIEIIVVDDGSTQPMKALEKAYQNVKVVKHKTNKGSAAARNSGFQAANGKYIALLDSDDQWQRQPLHLMFLASSDSLLDYQL